MTKGVPFWVAPFFVNKSAGFVHRLVFVVDLVYRKAIFVHRIIDHKDEDYHGCLR